MLSGDIVGATDMLAPGRERTGFRGWANLTPFWSKECAGKQLGSGIKQGGRDTAGLQARLECTGLSPARGSVPPDRSVQEHKSLTGTATGNPRILVHTKWCREGKGFCLCLPVLKDNYRACQNKTWRGSLLLAS